jgi:predicted transcriptional regulator
MGCALILVNMSEVASDLPDLSGISDFEREIFEFVLENWPTTALEIAENFREDVSDREKKKRLSTKYAYYLKKLVEKRLILCKKAGNTLIVWPLVVEKYRAVHEIFRGEKQEFDNLFFKRLSQKSLQNSRMVEKNA